MFGHWLASGFLLFSLGVGGGAGSGGGSDVGRVGVGVGDGGTGMGRVVALMLVVFVVLAVVFAPILAHHRHIQVRGHGKSSSHSGVEERLGKVDKTKADTRNVAEASGVGC